MSGKKRAFKPWVWLLSVTLGPLGLGPHLWQAPPSRHSTPTALFTDITEQAGITWQHFGGESEDRFLNETMGGGIALVDFDNDGRIDLFFVNGGETPRGKSSTPVRNALYRNLGQGRFEDIVARAGIDRLPFYGMGVAAADYDNDGFQDLFITGYPASALFRNSGEGTFTDVTEKAGVKNLGKWAASAAWFDYNRDGFLDLFICNYAKFSYADEKYCEFGGKRGYCEQKAYQGDAVILYRNNGDGTFTDVTAQAGIQKHVGRALGVVAVDVNGDGWQDLFVACDATPNWLLVNRQNGTFEDVAFEAELAYSPEGIARAGMGVDAGDLNHDGWPDFVVTNFTDEYHALYFSTQPFPYTKRTRESGLAAFTRPYVGFGTHFIDYDNDSDLDLVIVNGHVNEFIELVRKDLRYRGLPLLLANQGNGIFRNLEEQAGPVFRTPYVARGLAVGDLDNDGSTDIVFVCLNAKPAVLRNTAGGTNQWVGFQLVGTRSNRDAIGAKLSLRLTEKTLVRWVTGGSSYLASNDNRVIFGLGTAAPRTVTVTIRWPSGATQTMSELQPNRYHRITEPSP